MCNHRDKVRNARRKEVKDQLQAQNLSLAQLLQTLKVRARAGEFLGQDDGDIIRVSFVQYLSDASEEDIEQAVREIGAYIVVGVILFR